MVEDKQNLQKIKRVWWQSCAVGWRRCRGGGYINSRTSAVTEIRFLDRQSHPMEAACYALLTEHISLELVWKSLLLSVDKTDTSSPNTSLSRDMNIMGFILSWHAKCGWVQVFLFSCDVAVYYTAWIIIRLIKGGGSTAHLLPWLWVQRLKFEWKCGLSALEQLNELSEY